MVFSDTYMNTESAAEGHSTTGMISFPISMFLSLIYHKEKNYAGYSVILSRDNYPKYAPHACICSERQTRVDERSESDLSGMTNK